MEKMLVFLSVLLAVLLGPAPVKAESGLKGGMRHTIVTPPVSSYQETPAARNAPAPGVSVPGVAAPGPETAAEKVWRKYKALAAGQYEGEEPAAPAAAKTALPAQPSPAQGFSSVLQKYHANQALKSQMRSLSIAPPPTPGG
ncbi:MAG: hypothetical protein K9G62_02335 [Alphaproteobacteria bacterium]|nr:hypothetical protein [Alphaproteobacteria bacterium]